jgi:hypothetical protein
MMHDLATTLDEVRDALIAGSLDQLPQLTREIERLLQGADRLSEADMTVIRTKATRNTATLNAAMQGVRAAQRRLADLREAATGHRTYGPRGQRSAVANPFSTLRQRV